MITNPGRPENLPANSEQDSLQQDDSNSFRAVRTEIG